MKENLITAIAVLGIAIFFVYQNNQKSLASLPTYEVNQVAIAKPIIESKGMSCKVTKVSDGDTVTADCDGQQTKIRLCGIDAPEKAQPLGIDSKQFLSNLVLDKDVKVYPIESDRYGRTVAEIEVVSDRINVFVNAEIVEKGLAYHYKQYSGNCLNKELIEDAEVKAKSKNIGVWSGDYQKPWDYRKSKK